MSRRPERQRSAELLASAALVGLALTVGLGDIAQVSPLDTLILNGVHGLLLLVIALTVASALQQRRWPRLPREVSGPTAVWLGVLLASAALAQAYRSEAIAALVRPASGAALAWAVCEICRAEQRWLRLLRALSLGGLAVALVALADASGASVVRIWLGGLRDGEVPIGDIPRVAATLSHPNEAAMLLELSLPMLVAWAWTSRSRWRSLPALAAVCSMLAILLTFSRAGIVPALATLGSLAVEHLLNRRYDPFVYRHVGLRGIPTSTD